MDKIPSWESYQSVSEEQYLDLINYSKELIEEDSEHRITFLVIAQGIDSVEKQEYQEKEELEKTIQQQKEIEDQQRAEKSLIRENSKSILNSIYGI
jgi:hypothetical protein